MKKADDFFQTLIRKDQSPGVTYHFFNKEKLIYSFRGGSADIKSGMAVTGATTFNAFSVTKTFTALAILQLQEHGRLDIDQSAKSYLPEFPYGAEITIRNLLTHTAGIPNPVPLRWIHLAEDDASFSRDRFFEEVMATNKKLKSLPGQKFVYTNLGYFLLGRIIENISGLRYEEYIQRNILDLLNLKTESLGFTISDISKHAKGYIKKNSFLNLVLGFFIDKSKYMSPAEGAWKPFKTYYINGTSYGGLIGTAGAFVVYLQSLLDANCPLISTDWKKKMLSENLTSDSKPSGMCMSWFTGNIKGHQYFSHAGGGGGYYCEIRLYPDLQRGSVIMFNRTGMNDERFLNKIDPYFL
ncbi:serine hydrolase domain-containing protein [Pollutibacter soli]|uniref:serine hydrolase domain-containing protein n=1 Tax=Pollutibacter soli TaxID=3034157 RepID=UPI0030133480